MAPSVEINRRNDSQIKLPSSDKLFYPPSELKMTNGRKNDKIISDKTKEETEEKVKTYRTEKPFASRKEEAAAIRKKFPTKIPLGLALTEERRRFSNYLSSSIIVDRFHKESSLPLLERSKFLVPQEITMSQFVTIIRNRMKLGSNQAFYLLVNNRSMLSLSKTLAEVYKDHKEEDGFLYMTYASQEENLTTMN